MTRPRAGTEPTARDLLDEAIHLLRSASLRTWLTYFTAVLPCVFTAIYFVFDMSRNAYADERCVALALALTLTFVWMKFWQSAFARKLRAQLAGSEDRPWTLKQATRVLTAQTFLQATGLLVLPLALVPFLPFPWAYAYYHNVTALADGKDGSLRTLHRRALTQALKWPRQNFFLVKTHSILTVVVWCNWLLTVVVVIPQLLQALLGLETSSTLNALQSINTSTLTLTVALTYLVVDPLARAAYAIRVFQGESIATGEDLLAEFARLRGTAIKILAVTLLGIAGGFGVHSELTLAQEAPLPARTAVDATEFDQAAGRVLARSEYAWRLPRERVSTGASGEEGWLTGFLRGVGEMLRNGVEWIGDQIIKLLRWILGNRSGGEASTGGLSLPSPQTLGVLLLVAVGVVLLTLLLVARWKQSKKSPENTISAVADPDMESAETLANELPENEWLRLAEELLRRGELRLALRAFHFAGLSYLAQRGLIAIARFKSNRDYERELLRKAHALPLTTSAFSQNVRAFERVWYGQHAATPAGVADFRAALDELRGGS